MSELREIDKMELDETYEAQLILTAKETTALERIFLYQYIPYNDLEAHEVCRRIMKFNKELNQRRTNGRDNQEC